MRLLRPLYVARWNEDVAGRDGPTDRLRPAPKSRSGYHYFSGRITSGLFAPLSASSGEAMAHYEHQRTVARCRVVEDATGIRLYRPGPFTRLALRRCRLAGDWRRIAGGLELVGVVAVERAR